MKTKLAVVGAVGVLALACAATSGTYAWFSDNTDSPVQRVQAGTLRLRVGVLSQPVPVENLRPGEQRLLGRVTISGTGDLGGVLTLDAVDIVEDGATSVPDERAVDPDNAGNLGAFLRLSIVEDGAAGPVRLVRDIPLAALDQHDLGLLAPEGAPGSTRVFTLWLTVDPSAGNEIQGDRTTFRLLAGLRQAA
jgi:predicted ribosomally synthesized peptide with SipW-like signal peptide